MRWKTHVQLDMANINTNDIIYPIYSATNNVNHINHVQAPNRAIQGGGPPYWMDRSQIQITGPRPVEFKYVQRREDMAPADIALCIGEGGNHHLMTSYVDSVDKMKNPIEMIGTVLQQGAPGPQKHVIVGFTLTEYFNMRECALGYNEDVQSSMDYHNTLASIDHWIKQKNKPTVNTARKRSLNRKIQSARQNLPDEKKKHEKEVKENYDYLKNQFQNILQNEGFDKHNQLDGPEKSFILLHLFCAYSNKGQNKMTGAGAVLFEKLLAETDRLNKVVILYSVSTPNTVKFYDKYITKGLKKLPNQQNIPHNNGLIIYYKAPTPPPPPPISPRSQVRIDHEITRQRYKRRFIQRKAERKTQNEERRRKWRAAEKAAAIEARLKNQHLLERKAKENIARLKQEQKNQKQAEANRRTEIALANIIDLTGDVDDLYN